MRIGFFGEVMQEHRADGCGFGFGGDTLNTALYLHRLSRAAGSNLRVQYFTMLGHDRASEQLLDTLQAEDFALCATQHPDKSLGQYWIDIDAMGERSFRYQRDDSAAKHYFRHTDSALEQALAAGSLDALYISGISLAILTETDRLRLYSAINSFVRRGGWLLYDNNFRPLLWNAPTAARWQQKLLPLSCLVLLTDSDERLIWQQATAGAADLVKAALQAGAATVVLKCGPAPCWIAKRDGCWQVPALQVAQVVDSSGAGDAFAAGFLARFCMNPTDLMSAAQAGHQLAATVVQHHGAVIPLARMPVVLMRPVSDSPLISTSEAISNHAD
jgi:2-dehydro-3-deoxygluconokinase